MLVKFSESQHRYDVVCMGMLDGVTTYRVTPPLNAQVDVRYINGKLDETRTAYSGGPEEFRLCVCAVEEYIKIQKAEDREWLRRRGLLPEQAPLAGTNWDGLVAMLERESDASMRCSYIQQAIAKWGPCPNVLGDKVRALLKP